MGNRNSYGSIIKATTLFGGVKVFQIVVSIIRSKFIAVLLGPSGMGIAGLITSSTDMISTLTGFGLRTSGIRDVTQAYALGDQLSKDTILTVLRRLILITGILGALLTFLFSSYLSEWAFGSKEYSTAFKLVSIILVFNQLNIGQLVLLQGTFNYKYLAKSTLLGSIIGVFFTVPLYYFLGIDGIVPAIIISSLILLFSSWYYSRKIPFKKVNLTLKQIFTKGKVMLSLGIALALSSFVVQGKDYLLKIYISNYGSIADVGLYTAGIASASTYIGLILNAMSTDYAPRLAALAIKNETLIEGINKQAVLLSIILSPIILVFIIFIKQIIIILYSSKFIEITSMIEWVMFGMFFRAISYSISFSFIARGDSKVFFLNELIASIYSLAFSVIGYYFMGLTGMGISFMFSYLVYSLHMYYLAKIKFKFSFTAQFWKIFLPLVFLSFLCLVSIKLVESNIYQYIIGVIFLGVTSWFSLHQINKIIGINNIKNFILRKLRK